MMDTPSTSGRLAEAPEHYFASFIEGRRGEILDAALAVWGEKGYEAGTMRAIAKRIGVTEPALYRHYEGKEAILSDIMSTAGDRIAGGLTPVLAGLTADNVSARLHEMIAMRRNLAAEQTRADGGTVGVLHTLLHAAPHNEHSLSLLRAHLALPMAAAVRAAIPRVDAGFGITRSAEEVSARVRVFMSLFVGYFSTSIILDAPPDDDAIIDALLGMMGWHDAA